MALKLRRRLEEFTNGMLAHRTSRCPSDSMATGAGSFKRVLGGEQAQFSDLPNMGAQERTELLDMLRSWNGPLGQKICYGA
jgi:hypothetical protein